MGARRRPARGRALCAVLVGLGLAAPAAASTVTDPIARLALEGGYDSNALYQGSADRVTRVSPELGLRLRDPLWDLRVAYGGDWVRWADRAGRGAWNHRLRLSLDADPLRRWRTGGTLQGAYAEDEVGLAQLGIFRTGERAAWIASGRGRTEYDASRRLVLAATLSERTVLFTDRTGGALHAPGAEALWHLGERLEAGGAYALGVFQDFRPAGTTVALSHGLKGRLRYRVTRMLEVDASAGPALWTGRGAGLVPEAALEARLSTRELDLRATASHGLGIGSTARPGLVDAVEFGLLRRFGRSYDLRADGGLWRSGLAPTGRDAVLGWAVQAEAGYALSESLRVALAATHFARLDDPSPALRRTTVAVRLAFALPERRR